MKLVSPTFNYPRIARGKSHVKNAINDHFPNVGRHFHRLGLKPKVRSHETIMSSFCEGSYKKHVIWAVHVIFLHLRILKWLPHNHGVSLIVVWVVLPHCLPSEFKRPIRNNSLQWLNFYFKIYKIPLLFSLRLCFWYSLVCGSVILRRCCLDTIHFYVADIIEVILE